MVGAQNFGDSNAYASITYPGPGIAMSSNPHVMIPTAYGGPGRTAAKLMHNAQYTPQPVPSYSAQGHKQVNSGVACDCRR